jgi:hypothetical protein
MIDKLIIQGVEYKPNISQETYLDLQVTNVSSVSLPAFNSVILEISDSADALKPYNLLYNSGKFECTVHALGAVYDAYGYVRELRDGYILVDILPKDVTEKDLLLKDVLLRYADYFDLYGSGYSTGWNVDRGYAKCIANSGARNNPASGAKWFMSSYTNDIVNGDTPIITLRLKDVLGAILSNARSLPALQPANIPDDIYISSHLSMYRRLMEEFAEVVGNPKIKGYWRLTSNVNSNSWNFVSDFALSEFNTSIVSVGNTTVNLLNLPLRAWWLISGMDIPDTMRPYITSFGVIYRLPNGSTRKVAITNGQNLDAVPASARFYATSSDYQFDYVSAVPCGLYFDVDANGLYNQYIKNNYSGSLYSKKIQYLNAVIQAYDIKIEPYGNAVDWYWCWRSVKERNIYVTSTNNELEKEFFFELFAGDMKVSEFLNSLYSHAGYAIKLNPFTVELEGGIVDYETPIKVLDCKLKAARPVADNKPVTVYTGAGIFDVSGNGTFDSNIDYGTVHALVQQQYPVTKIQGNNILAASKVGKLRYSSLYHNLYGEKKDKPIFIISKGVFGQVTYKGLATLALTQPYINTNAYAIRLQDLVDLNTNNTHKKALHAAVALVGAYAEFEFIGKVDDIKDILGASTGLFAIDGIICAVEEIKGYNPIDGKGILVGRLINTYVLNSI